MGNKLDIAEFLESPELLLQLCRELIDELDKRREGKRFDEQEKQLKEISKTIGELEKSGIPIPDELRSLKVNLAAKLAIREGHNNELETLTDGFEDILKDLRARTGRPGIPISGKTVSKKRSKTPKTNKDVLRKEIISALKRLGGKARLQQVLAEMERQLQDKLLPGDLERRQSGEIAWKNNACWERNRMKQEGILCDDSPRGTWELCEDYK